MKKVLLVVLAVVAVLVVGVGALVFSRPAIPEQQDLAPGVRVLKDGFVSLGVLDLGDGSVALVDCGMDATGKVVLEELARRGMGKDAVKAILVTHGHGDHVGGCDAFPGATVYALEAERGLLEGKEGSHGPLTRWRSPVRVLSKTAQGLQDGQVLTLGTTAVEVFAVPGHSAGSAAFLARGVLFLGDSADATGEGGVSPAAWVFTDDGDRNRASLQALAARLAPRAGEVKAVTFSHSGSVKGLEPLLAWSRQP